MRGLDRGGRGERPTALGPPPPRARRGRLYARPVALTLQVDPESLAPAPAPPSPPRSPRQEAAARHLWPHFGVAGQAATIYACGEGCHVWDEAGNGYLDALSSLFSVNAGHGREELADAAATSGYAPMGALTASDRVAQPLVEQRASFDHGLTFGGHPVAAAVALANLDLLEREDLLGHVRRSEEELGALLRGLLDLPLVGDVRGAGFFWGIELVADQATRAAFAPHDARALMAHVSAQTERRGLICRALGRGYPVVQLAPPLIAGSEEFAQIEAVLREVLEAAAR